MKVNKKILLIVPFSLILLILTFFISIAYFANRTLEKKILRLNNETTADISYSKIKFRNGNTLSINDLQITNDHLLLLQLDQLSVKFSLVKLIFGRTDIKSFQAGKVNINIEKTDSLCSYHVKRLKGEEQKKEKDFSDNLNSLQEKIWQIIPSNMQIDDLNIRMAIRDSIFNIHSKSVNMYENEVKNAEIHCFNRFDTSLYVVSLHLLPAKNEIKAGFQLANGPAIHLPFIDSRFHAVLSSASGELDIKSSKLPKGNNQFTGKILLKDVVFFHPDFNNTPLHLDTLVFDYIIKSSGKIIEVDSNSLITINRFSFHPYIRYEKGKAKRFTFGINTGKFEVKHLIASIPKGFFRQLEGFEASGHLEYHFFTDIPFNMLDSLVFRSKLTKHDFRVVSFGKLDYQPLLDTFTYTAFKKGIPQRTFAVGPNNPFYRNYNDINDFLKYAVVYSEDGAFFHHRGFIESAFRDALIVNIRRKHFARGGSTISMQFVKNVFLNSQKVLSRKMEEIIIVWLMENYRLLSKERIFEIYLNIIEWGPNIYGAAEASHFYFAKEPAQLSLSEAIFMAAIIPRPASFKYAFDTSGRLRNYFEGHYRLVLGRMVRSEMITQEEADRVLPDVMLSGAALKLVIPEENDEEMEDLKLNIENLK